MTDIDPVIEAQKTVFTSNGRDFATQQEALEWSAINAIVKSIEAGKFPAVMACLKDIVRRADDVRAILDRYIAARDGR